MHFHWYDKRAFYLQDQTGNRRFWVIPVTCTISKPIDVPNLLLERDAIWSAAVAAYLAGEANELAVEHQAAVEAENVGYLVESPWRAPIEMWLIDPMNRLKEITTDVLLTHAISKPVERQSRADQMQVASILKDLGYERRRTRVEGVLKWVYFRDSRVS